MKTLDKNTHQSRAGERGNVLWFILVAVALIGILTAVISRSGSTVDQSGDYEQASIKVSKILRYAKSIEAAIQDMKLNGISENDVSFANSSTATSYTNSSCDAAADQSWPSCLLFDERGAGLVYQGMSDLNDGSDWIFTGANNVGTSADPVGTYGSGRGNDLLMMLPNVSLALCNEINRKFGVGVVGTIPTDAGGIETGAFTGTFVGLNVIDGDPTPFEMNGHRMGCVTDADATPNVRYFYYTLLAR